MKTPHSNPIASPFSHLLPMAVREFRAYKNGYTYALCPRCRVTMEREFVRYCSNCGQKLDWRHYQDDSEISSTDGIF